MKLRTLVPVRFNNGIAAQKEAIIEMVLDSVAYSNSFTKIGVNYSYNEIDGQPFKSDAFYIDGTDEINALFDIIEPQLPPFENEVKNTKMKFLIGARYQMAQTFGILVEEIEFVE